MSLPALVVVTGPPGAGKTTLARALAPALRVPLVGRDEIKEGLLVTVGVHQVASEETARAAFEAFFDSVALLLERRVSLVAEAAFQHRLWVPRLERLQTFARVRLVVLALDPSLALARRVERAHLDPERGSYHHDLFHLDAYDPPMLDLPTLTVQTADGYDPGFDAIFEFANRA